MFHVCRFFIRNNRTQRSEEARENSTLRFFPKWIAKSKIDERIPRTLNPSSMKTLQFRGLNNCGHLDNYDKSKPNQSQPKPLAAARYLFFPIQEKWLG